MKTILLFVFLLASATSSLADDLELVKEPARLRFYCKGKIHKSGDKFTVSISDYIGDLEAAKSAATSLQKSLEGRRLFGPKQDHWTVFFLYECEHATDEHTHKSTSGGSMAKNWDDRFIITGQPLREGYSIHEVESSILRSMMRKPM